MNLKSVPTGHPANPFEAFRQLVYRYDVKTLAPLMGLKPGTLYNKADSDEDTHHQPTLRDVMSSARSTGDLSVLDAMEESFNRAAFDLTPYMDTSDEALLELFLKLAAETGDFHAVARNALLSHKFTAAHLNAIRAEAFDMVGALMTLLVRMEGLIDA